MPTELIDQWKNVDQAFSKQSIHFDEDDFSNAILQEWRKRIYKHVDQFIKPNSKILELNAGTGIDAIRFAREGHSVHATDISGGMIKKLKDKISIHSLTNTISIQQISFENIDNVEGKFDYVFSNFGGLNCIDDLKKVTRHLPKLLNEGGFITWVIMPRVSPWEWTWAFKGKFKEAFRRFDRNGTSAHLEGETFTTYYYSSDQIKDCFDSQFQLLKTEGLGIFSPPPSAVNFAKRFRGISNFLNRIDRVASKMYPFNRWGDHVIVTLEFYSKNY
ncbi:MAG: methyltransferase domain-containing protein [Bacteroidetes bacterium]|nr:methyltransferase domain-containing protein [Bacteroidota bacterium]MBI3482299.1 methyltransferase domain-containing protein [Bacteroidota bacterium]